MTEKTVNYTPEMTKDLVARYTAGMPLDMIAREMGKTVRSVTAKLVREGVYVAKSNQPSDRVTKSALVAQIAAGLGVDASSLDSFEKASKPQLEILAAHFAA